MKKKHHRISEFYLRHFATLDPKEEIWTYDLESDTVRSSTAEATGYEKHLYSVTLPDGTRYADIEDQIANVESAAAPVHLKLIRGEKISRQERANYASFMALMLVRTDAFRQQYAEGIVGTLQLRNFLAASDDDAFDNLVETYEQDTGKMLSDEDRQHLRDGMLNPQNFHIDVRKDFTLSALGVHEKLAPLFDKMSWAILRIPPPRFLITSDNPLVYGVPKPDQHPFYGGGLADKKVEVTLPLSSQKCLLATWNEYKGVPVVDAGREEVKELNRYRAINAMRYLYAPKRDTGIHALGKKYAHIKPGLRISGAGPDKYSSVKMKRRLKGEKADPAADH